MLKYFLAIAFVSNQLLAYAQKSFDYPVALEDTISDVYFDSLIPDPYQWMENPNDPRLTEWLSSQKKITKKIGNNQVHKLNLLRQIASMYNDVNKKTVEGYVTRKDGLKSKYEFDYKFKRLDRFPDLLYRPRGDGNYRMLVKSKNFHRGTNDNVLIEHRYVNEKDDLIAIEMSHNGSDWREVYFFNLQNGQQLPDTLKYIRASSQIIWRGKNVYYDRYDKPKEGRELLDKAKGQKLYYHKLGTPQSEDLMLFQNPDTTGTNAFRYLELNDKLFFYNFY